MEPAHFSLLTSASKQSLLDCLLKHWKDLDPILKKTNKQTKLPKPPSSFFVQRLGLSIPSQGSLNYNTILQLDRFCKREKKCIEVPYIQLLHLWDHPEWLHNRYLDIQTQAILCKPQDKHGEGVPEKPLMNDKATTPTAPSSALPAKPPQYSEPPNGCFPLQ
jgi:hypothetical protein